MRTSEAKRQAELAKLKQMLPRCAGFDRWLAETGELPPDFDALPAVPYPQDLLSAMRDGRRQRVSREDWPARRAELGALVERWLLGAAPPPPGNVRAVEEGTKEEDGHITRTVRLEFGPDHAAKLRCWLWLPTKPTKERLPVFLVDNFRYTSFAKDALDGGQFAICIYNATDPVYTSDKKDPSEAYKDLFGKFDWSEFRRRGWSASRAVDWLATLDMVDPKRIYIGGHSRSAKQSLAAAAFDERIAGVVASSPGSGGSLHFRYCDQYYFGESAELLTRVFPLWVSPRVRFFTGRENKLPADCHMIYALIAPRPVLMSTAMHDWVENTWAVEQMYQSIKPVYDLLGGGENLALRYHRGQHSPDAGTLRDHSRFLVLASEGKSVAEAFAYRPFHPWNYASWVAGNAEVPAPAQPAKGGASAQNDPTLDGDRAIKPGEWKGRARQIRSQVEWLLGEGPAYEAMKVEIGSGESEEEAKLLARNFPAPPQRTKCRFGPGINGNLYYPSPKRNEARLPAIIFLAPLHTSSGYTGTYRAGDIAHIRLSRGGFVTLAFDPIGTANRQEERRGFYDACPRWSLMGKMVQDARHAIDAARAVPNVDPSKVYLVGFGMGGMVAMLTAAVDERVAKVVSIAGFTPFRTDTDASPTGGVRRWSHLYGWLPRLGAYVGREREIPIDFPEIVASLAPRPALIVAPTMDWHANYADVALCVELAQKAYALLDAERNLKLLSPQRWCELNNEMLDAAIAWLRL